jgi:hypothetical protein
MIRAKKPGLDVLPGFGRQVHGLADLPVADHGAEFFGGAVDKCLFFFGQLGLGVGQQLVPVRAAAEQLAVPPHGAGIDGIAFGFRHRRQGFLKPAEQRRGEVLATQVGQQQGAATRSIPRRPAAASPVRGSGTHRQQVDGDDAQGGQGAVRRWAR